MRTLKYRLDFGKNNWWHASITFEVFVFLHVVAVQQPFTRYFWLLHWECRLCSHLPPSGCTRVLRKQRPSLHRCSCTWEHMSQQMLYFFVYSFIPCSFAKSWKISVLKSVKAGFDLTWTSWQSLYWSGLSSETLEPPTPLKFAAGFFLWCLHLYLKKKTTKKQHEYATKETKH